MRTGRGRFGPFVEDRRPDGLVARWESRHFLRRGGAPSARTHRGGQQPL